MTNDSATDCDHKLNIDCVEYFDSKFNDLEKRLALRDELTEKALEKANQNLDFRLASLNHLTERLSGFVTKSEYETRHENLVMQLAWLTKTVYIGMGILLVIEVAWKYLKP